jgi:hypothetical protein
MFYETRGEVMNSLSKYFNLILLLLPSCTVLVFAQSITTTTPTTSTGAGGLLIAYLICNSMKRRPIGGWLLYFYMQLYGGALISILILFTNLKNFNVDLWDDRALYTLYLISTIPTYITILAQVTVGSVLLFHRFKNSRTVNWLRVIFVISFVFELIGLLIDSAHWPKSVEFDFLPLISSILWFFYFTRSKRVALVFKEANWDPNIMYPLAPGSAPTQVSKRWLKIYAIVLISIIVIILFLLFLTSKE